MTYNELLTLKGTNNISFADMLQTQEWIDKRKKIIMRDKNKCRNCGVFPTDTEEDIFGNFQFHFWFINDDLDIRVAKRPYHLEVFHKYYIINRLPWEFNDDALITLCQYCHEDFHKKNNLKVFASDGITPIEIAICSKCNGSGYLPEYHHVQSGICFKCRGNGNDFFNMKFNSTI